MKSAYAVTPALDTEVENDLSWSYCFHLAKRAPRQAGNQWKHHVTTVMITTLTPVLAGLIAIGFLMPLLVRLKLPGGTEADLSANVELLSTGPTGHFDLSSLRFASIANPTGEFASALRLATRQD